jgi:hypothetical protein
MKTTILKPIVVALLLMIGACAGTPETTARILEQRAQGRWDALLSEDLEAAYQYFSPGQRQTVRYQDFVRQIVSRSVRWTGASFVEVAACDGDACTVKIRVHFQVKAPVGAGQFKSSQLMRENWIRSDGQWYFLPADVL